MLLRGKENYMRRIFLSVITLVVLVLSCKKEDANGPSNIIDLSTFSGKWHGLKTIYKIGQCQIDRGDSSTYSLAMTWSVNSAGDIIIQDSMQTTAIWTGKIQTNLNISLRKILTMNCYGTPTVDTTYYNGTIKQESGTNKLTVESTETWCPLQGCIFDVHYAIDQL
jgi:hypothetical protein